MRSLSAFTGPLSAEEFLTRYWSREGVHLRDSDRTFDAYLNWEGFNAILNSDALTFPNTALSREDGPVAPSEYTKRGDGRVIDLAPLMTLYRDGASLSIRGGDSYWPPLRTLVTTFEDAFSAPVYTNIYCSPANIQGRTCHYDLHEVLVLQVEGQKRWRVYRPTTEFPVEPWRFEDAPDKTSDPYIDVVLSKGDVLYVPRGHWHYAIAHDSQSLHVTVGVTCRRGDAFIDWLVPQLRNAPAFRENAPLVNDRGLPATLPSSHELLLWAGRLRQALIDVLAAPDLIERFAAEFFAEPPSTIQVHMPVDGDPGPFHASEYVFTPPIGQRHVVEAVGNGARLKVAGTEVELEAVDARLLAHVLRSESFTIDDLARHAPAVGRDELAEILETLVRSGLLQATPVSRA